MAEGCASLGAAWAYRPDGCWISDAFAGETEALTRALRISLSDDSSAVSAASLSPPSSSLLHRHLVEPDLAATKRARNPVPAPNAGRVAKRKSRASKRSATTFITADPANFRQMVQQVTGAPASVMDRPVEAVRRPEPQTLGRGGGAFAGLPKLDTSDFFLHAAAEAAPVGSDCGAAGTAVEAAAGFDFEPFPCFPTLESWTVI